MIAGMNLKGRVWRLTASDRDDSIGGAVPSGTVIYENIQARIKAEEPTLALLEQGLETPTIFSAQLSYPYLTTGTFDYQHNDQYEVTDPPISPWYGKKFRIIGIQNVEYNDARRYVNVKMRRTVTANSNELQ